MEYLSPEMYRVEAYDIVVSMEDDACAILCQSIDGNILKYIHETDIDKVDTSLWTDDRVRKKVVRVNTAFTLVPVSDFDVNEVEKIAGKAFSFEDITHCRHFILDHIAGVYLLDDRLMERIKTNCKGFEIEHSVMQLLRKEPSADPSIVAHWTQNGMIVLGYAEGLRLANYYHVKVPEDAIYYILAAYQHTGLDPLFDPLHMSGRILEQSIYCDKLSGFVRNLHWKDESSQLPPHFGFEPHMLYHLTG